MTDTSQTFSPVPLSRFRFFRSSYLHFDARLRGATAALVLAAACAATAGSAQAAPPGRCPDAGRATLLQGDVPRFATSLGQDSHLRIVTIGSSSTAGAGASSPDNSYPSQLEDDLERRFPGRDIEVINVGVNGQEAPDMLARLDTDVLAFAPDLVIWQFGSNGLMRGRPLAEMETAARIGIERLKGAGIEVMLMDLQHAPRIDSLAGRDDVLRMMERLSVSSGAALFHRYRMMKAWANSLGPRYSEMVSADDLHMTDASYRCMADALAANLQVAADQQLAANDRSERNNRNSRGLATSAVSFPLQGGRAGSALNFPLPRARAASAP